jgi:hypothetical protein
MSQFLESLSREKVRTKKSLYLFSPAMFDPSLCPDTDRGLGNVVFSAGIMLDNDGGDLTLDQFAALFVDLRIIAYNSFNSTPEKPRWRAYIPTKTIMTAEVHEVIARSIIHQVEQAGYEVHGFDMSKLHAASLFYRPCQLKDPAAARFEDSHGPNRRLLDPCEWLESVPDDGEVPVDPVRQFNEQIRNKDGFIEWAKEQWRAAPHQDGYDHDNFFRLGVHLGLAGCSKPETVLHLNTECQFARDPKKRQGKIKDVVRSLRSYGLLN